MLVISLLVIPASVSAQTRISGHVIDKVGKPVANIAVTLHGIQAQGGAQISVDTTDADGAFGVTIAKPDTNEVYIAAVAYKGELYVGDLLKPPFPAIDDYNIRVGVNPVRLPTAEPPAPQVTPEEQQHDRTKGIAVVIVAGLIIMSVVLLGMSRRAPAHRRWLVELARLEDELATKDQPHLRQRRAELRIRLKG